MASTAATVRISINSAQATAIDRFQEAEKLATRTEAIRLLLEIALDSVNGEGWRFWDRAPG